MKCFLASLLATVAILTAQNNSPAQSSIDQARKAVAANPSDPSGYNLLGIALVRRAQETSDDRFYDQAAEVIHKSLALSPGDFEAGKVDVMVLLGKHEYPDALREAQALNRRIPDDLTVYGLLTDAYSALGDYKNAEISAQWMLNLRPGNSAAFVYTAHLREAFGDMNGAYEALELAFQATSPTQNADRASLLTQMGRERRLAANNEAAGQLLKQALELFPGYNPALGELAEVYLNEKRYADAIELLRQRVQAVPAARSSYELAKAYEISGHNDEAKATYTEFLREALLESAQKNNSNRELVFYFADYAHQPAKALDVAKQEYAWRHDINTLDAYAWALHANGQDQEARKQMDLALAVGTRDPQILAHSEQIKIPSRPNRSQLTQSFPKN